MQQAASGSTFPLAARLQPPATMKAVLFDHFGDESVLRLENAPSPPLGSGTTATTLAKRAGLRVIVTAGSREKCDRCLAHGADAAINYREEDFVEKARGADIILDHIGARYLPRDLEALGTGGRVVLIGS